MGLPCCVAVSQLVAVTSGCFLVLLAPVPPDFPALPAGTPSKARAPFPHVWTQRLRPHLLTLRAEAGTGRWVGRGHPARPLPAMCGPACVCAVGGVHEQLYLPSCQIYALGEKKGVMETWGQGEPAVVP